MGRPTDWTPTLGEEILSLMTQGLSLAAAAAELGVHRQRVYEWEAKHSDFADTVKLGRVKRQLFLERRLLTADAGPVVTSTIFALKNASREDWQERTLVGSDPENPLPANSISVSGLSESALREIAALNGDGG